MLKVLKYMKILLKFHCNIALLNIAFLKTLQNKLKYFHDLFLSHFHGSGFLSWDTLILD